MRILQPAEWSKPRGFSHGVEFNGPGRWIVLAGQTGGDEKGDYAPELAAQVGVALKRIVKLLGEAGAGPEHIVRLTWYVVDMDEYRRSRRDLGRVYRDVIGAHYPAMAVVGVKELFEPKARVEIEATAVVP